MLYSSLAILTNLASHGLKESEEMFRCLVLTICLAGCAPRNPVTLFESRPAYPVTTVKLQDGKTLVHRAGPKCDTPERPVVGGGDGERTYSKYTLLDRNGVPLVEGPSFLSDPAGAGEFAAYYKDNDRLRVIASSTGETVLAVEDRSPTFPRKAFILFQSTGGKWTGGEIRVETFAPAPGVTATYAEYPEVIGLTDRQIELKSGEIRKTIPIGKSVPGA